jgi:hypothetical protein
LLDPSSVSSWINAVTVVVLAIVTWRYAKSAKRQAEAAESQARAAAKQAEVAERQLAILQSELEQQAGVALARLKEDIAELGQIANHWFQQMTIWNLLTPHPGVDLLPAGWGVSLEHARRMSRELHEELLVLQRSSRKVSLMIDQFSGRMNAYRSDTEANEIKGLLMQIVRGCEAASKKLIGLA